MFICLRDMERNFRISSGELGGRHSSSPSIITRRGYFLRVSLGTAFKGSTTRYFICMAGVRNRIVGSRSREERIVLRISGFAWISWYTIAATSRELSLRPAAVRQKKKLAANSASHNSAIDCAIADFPAAAGSYIQRTNFSPFSGHSFTHSSIFCCIASRVFG